MIVLQINATYHGVNTGIQETVSNAITGLAVDNGDYKAFYDSIIKVKILSKRRFKKTCRKWV